MDNHNAIAIIAKFYSDGSIHILSCLKESTRGQQFRVLPGGTSAGVETPTETLQRETIQEISKARNQNDFKIFWIDTPIHTKKCQADGGKGIHTKYGFIVTEFQGELRTEDLIEPDGDILHPPEWFEISLLMEILRNSRSLSFQLEALEKAFMYFAQDKQVFVRYETEVTRLAIQLQS